ncbi:MAG: hypothetical protein OXG58_00875 [Gemmatimonadetes bacterium]|nr:hypothetical protein [Gemmatimonadota bacterium]MCY3942320.1 hypothetical protein [Gemmatimonadota bacterium]
MRIDGVARFGLPGLFVLATASPLAGQGIVQDLVISGGMAGEAWRGDFVSFVIPQVDSTNQAVAWVGEWSANGIFNLARREQSSLDAIVDVGFRQFAPGGFQLRRYSPREYNALLTARYHRDVADGRGGALVAEATARKHGIDDRPPMPLYLPPGYRSYRLKAGYETTLAGSRASLTVTGESADYGAPVLLPYLDLLDRRSAVVEAAGTRRSYRSPDSGEYSEVRFFGSYRYHTYPRQGLEGVFRVDHAVGLGGGYELSAGRMDLGVSLDGTRSWSNSRRVEYHAGRLGVQMQLWKVWREFGLSVASDLAVKRYRHQSEEYAPVPGEEADNGAALYAEITRSVARNMDAAFRLGWQRVETSFTGAYYTRFGGGFFLRVRPTR